nr:hypothetical protein CFP56_72407 [Quercus suber]
MPCTLRQTTWSRNRPQSDNDGFNSGRLVIVQGARAQFELGDLVWTALTYMTRLPRPVDEACVMQVVRVSGTIRKAEEEAIRRARLSIRRAQQAAAYSRLGVAGAGETGAQYIDDDELAHDPLGTANGNGNMSEDEVEDDGSASED